VTVVKSCKSKGPQAFSVHRPFLKLKGRVARRQESKTLPSSARHQNNKDRNKR
jgi:hypothetical protein